MKTRAIYILTILLCSCSGTKEQESKPLSIVLAEQTKTAWEKSSRPISIVIGEGVRGLSSVGVTLESEELSPSERESFTNAEFTSSDSIYTTNQPHAQLADTAARIYVYYPCPLGHEKEATLTAPFAEHLYGIETERYTDSIRSGGDLFRSIVKMNSSMSLLQLHIYSQNIADTLDELRLSGTALPTAGTYNYYTGSWSDIVRGGDIDLYENGLLLNNGKRHDFYLIPTPDESNITIIAKINGAEYHVKTTLSPMQPGCMIRLNLRYDGNELKIKESWITEGRPLKVGERKSIYQVEPGFFLRADGTLTADKDSTCVAIVTETDGVHGTAIGLRDYPGEYRYSAQAKKYGKGYPTIDGHHHLVKINPHKDEVDDGIRPIFFFAKKEYSEAAALSVKTGIEDSNNLINNIGHSRNKEGAAPIGLLMSRHPGCYVPSLRELADLYLSYNPIKGEPSVEGIEPLAGEYVTSTEADENNFYAINFDTGIIDGTKSKTYSRGKVRLFWIF